MARDKSKTIQIQLLLPLIYTPGTTNKVISITRHLVDKERARSQEQRSELIRDVKEQAKSISWYQEWKEA